VPKREPAANNEQTFLFMDLVGFTALTAEQGDDSAAEVALRLYANVRQLLPHYAGEEIKTIGDAMMIRCEDPRKAVDLGLRISEQIAADAGFPPVRIGVHTGSAVAREGDWYGSGVNVAARLCSAAGGEVLVSDAARRAAGPPSHIDFGPRRMHWLKNVPEPVDARSAALREDAAPRRSLRDFAKRPRRPGAGISMRYSEVTG
jgi:class 3 adenylate cyclase